MDHMANKISFPVYEPSVTVVCKLNSFQQKELNKNTNVTQYGKIPDLVLELYKKSNPLEEKE